MNWRTYARHVWDQMLSDVKTHAKTTLLACISGISSVVILLQEGINPETQTLQRIKAQIAFPLVLFAGFVLLAILRAPWKLHLETLKKHDDQSKQWQADRAALEQSVLSSEGKLTKPRIVLSFNPNAQWSHFYVKNAGGSDATGVSFSPLVRGTRMFVWPKIERIEPGESVALTDYTRSYNSLTGVLSRRSVIDPLPPDGSRPQRNFEWLMEGESPITLSMQSQLLLSARRESWPVRVTFGWDEGRKSDTAEFNIEWDKDAVRQFLVLPKAG